MAVNEEYVKSHKIAEKLRQGQTIEMRLEHQEDGADEHRTDVVWIK